MQRSCSPTSPRPLLFADLLGRDRPLYLQHLGPDQKTGWYAILALVPGAGRGCVLRWASARFADPCSGAVYPANGTGLTRYPTTVLPSDRVVVNLRTTG